MMIRYGHLILCIGVLAMALAGAFAIAEQQLAGMRIGMRSPELLKLKGDPTAIMIAQPPLTEEAVVVGRGAAPQAEGSATTLIFLYEGQEIEVEQSIGDTPGAGTMPAWAYSVRVAKLSLDQQQFFYRINPYSAVGVVITGQGAEARVSDIIACSYEPFIVFTTPAQKRDAARWPKISAGTSKGVLLGSKFNEVLSRHKWTPYLYPFSTTAVANITITDSRGIVLPKDEVKLPSRASSQPTPLRTASFTNGGNLLLEAGFVRDCLMIYPPERLLLTLVDFTVVRIQIGDGVVAPPTLPL